MPGFDGMSSSTPFHLSEREKETNEGRMQRKING